MAHEACIVTGGCFCGAVRWRHKGVPIRHLICHCRSCQRAASSGFAAFFGSHDGAFTITGPVQDYASSAGASRAFCRECGTRLWFRSDRWPGEVHLHIGTLDDPTEYRPDTHVCLSDKATWLTLADDITGREGFSEIGPKDATNHG